MTLVPVVSENWQLVTALPWRTHSLFMLTLMIMMMVMIITMMITMMIMMIIMV